MSRTGRGPAEDREGALSAASERFERLRARDVAALLASTLGWEKSEELVATIAHAAGFDPSALTPDDAVVILDMLSRQQGLVGVAARFARSRADTLRRARVRSLSPAPAQTGLPPEPTPVSGIQRTPSSPHQSASWSHLAPKRLPLAELVSLIAPTIGQEKANETIAFAIRVKGIQDDKLTQEQALAVFEVLSQHDGIVGVTARFAKARLVLRYRA
jgi:hypothetical protein